MRGGILDAAGEVTRVQQDHLLRTTLLVLIVVVPVFLALPVLLWRYRLRRTDSEYKPDWNFWWPLEFLIWGVPVVIVALLGFSLWHTVHRIDPYRPLDTGSGPPVHVQVVGMDWKWLFIYPDEHIASVNRLVIPAGRQVAFDITADGPMMSFIVPQLGGQIYAMAGMRTKLHLIADRPGDYRGENTQYNGKHFAQQQFTVKAVSEAQYENWLSGARGGKSLDTSAYSALARPSVVERPLIFGDVPPGLFDTVIASYSGSGSATAHHASASLTQVAAQ